MSPSERRDMFAAAALQGPPAPAEPVAWLIEDDCNGAGSMRRTYFSAEGEALVHASGRVGCRLVKLYAHPAAPAGEAERPRIVCLCGSTRFAEKFNEVAAKLTQDGVIVVRPEVVTYSSEADPQRVDPALKERLDALHFRKIELADEVLVLNVGGYVGFSTGREIEHAKKLGKAIRYLEDAALGGQEEAP